MMGFHSCEQLSCIACLILLVPWLFVKRKSVGSGLFEYLERLRDIFRVVMSDFNFRFGNI